MSDLERLLDLQANDTASDQLRHRRATLPERATLVDLAARVTALTAQVEEPTAERDGLRRDQRKVEDEIATLEEKIASVDRQLYGEHITSPKEAQALQADLESLRRRQSDLEDQVLELMERIEPLDVLLDDCDQAVAAVGAEIETTTAALAVAEAAVDAELATVASARAALVEVVPASLLAEYDQRRTSSGGVVIARLQGSTCQGCFLSLAPAEVDELRRRPADEVVLCPDCGRILVR